MKLATCSTIPFPLGFAALTPLPWDFNRWTNALTMAEVHKGKGGGGGQLYSLLGYPRYVIP